MLQRIKVPRPAPEFLIILSLALVNILFHLLLPEYGYHRDEMYYVAIADGFSFSNLDMSPVSPSYASWRDSLLVRSAATSSSVRRLSITS